MCSFTHNNTIQNKNIKWNHIIFLKQAWNCLKAIQSVFYVVLKVVPKLMIEVNKSE